MKKLELARGKIVLSIRADVADALAAWSSARELVTAAKAGLNEAREALRLAKESYAAGAATQLDVLDAETAFQNAELSLSQARYALATARAAYIAAIGLVDAPSGPPGNSARKAGAK